MGEKSRERCLSLFVAVKSETWRCLRFTTTILDVRSNLVASIAIPLYIFCVSTRTRKLHLQAQQEVRFWTEDASPAALEDIINTMQRLVIANNTVPGCT
jgi:hypothetical protein